MVIEVPPCVYSLAPCYISGVVVVIVTMLVVCLRNRGFSEYEEEQNVYLIAREVRVIYVFQTLMLKSK